MPHNKQLQRTVMDKVPNVSAPPLNCGVEPVEKLLKCLSL